MLKYVCGEDATLLYILECEWCGAIVMHNLSNEDCLHPSAKFCPLCEAQENHYYEAVYSASEIRANQNLQHWLNEERILGLCLGMGKTTIEDFINQWKELFTRIKWEATNQVFVGQDVKKWALSQIVLSTKYCLKTDNLEADKEYIVKELGKVLQEQK